MIEETPGKSISDELLSVLEQLSLEQIRFLVARQDCTSDKEAADAVGIKADTVYHWPEIVKQAAALWKRDAAIIALHLRRRNLAKAMAVKAAGLDSSDEKIRQSVATEIVEWELGRAKQSMEHSGPDGKALTIVIEQREAD